MFAKLAEVIGNLFAPKAPAPSKPRGVPRAPAAARVAAASLTAPRQSLDPRPYEHVPGADVWQFCVPDPAHACPGAQARANQRTSPQLAVPVPLPGCDHRDCTCSYRLLRNERKGPRRTGEERRELVRFEVKKIDRRTNGGRRKEDGWSGGAKP